LRAVARRLRERRGDVLTGERRRRDVRRRERAEAGLLLTRGGGIDAGVPALPVSLDLRLVVLGRGPARGRQDLGGEQREQDAVLVGGPDAAVAAQERRTRRLLA